MSTNIREKYRVTKSNVDESYEYQLGLKNNEEYARRADETLLEMANIFKEMYPNVGIEPPRGREKSSRSMRNKIENLEVERLCKIYALEGLAEEEQKLLFQAILKGSKNKHEDSIKKILFGKINNLKDVDKIISEKEIPEKIKTALLRVTKTRLIHEDIKNSEKLQDELDKKYGEQKVQETGKLKYDLLKWSTIEKITPKDIEKIHTPFEYLQLKDIRGIKLIVANVPDDVNIEDEELKNIIEERKKYPEKERKEYNDLCCIGIGRDFVARLINDQELLARLNLEVMENGYKHKEKQNGYIAEHVKFQYRDKPEYTLELQLRSIYREDLSRANGPAAHDKRSGKKRVFPKIGTKKEFLKQAEDMVPKYTVLMNENGKYYIHRCSMTENMLEYYLGYVDLNKTEYKTIMEYIEKNEEKEL